MKDLKIVGVRFVNQGGNLRLSDKVYYYKCEKGLVTDCGDLVLVSVHSNDISKVDKCDIVNSTKCVMVAKVYDDINSFIKDDKKDIELEDINKHIIGNVTNQIINYQHTIKQEVEKENAKKLIEKRIQELDTVSKYKYILEQTKDKELESLMKTAGFLD